MQDGVSIRFVEDEEGRLEYQLCRKKVKNINLRVRPDGSVMVSANRRVPLAFLDEFVREKSAFIRKAQQEYQRRQEEKTLQYATGEKVRLLGRQLELSVQEGFASRVLQKEGVLYLYVPRGCTREKKENMVLSWYRKEAGKYLPEACRQIFPLFAPYHIPYPEIRIRRMTSRWGSCQPKRGVVTLSTMLMERPKEAVEYVIVHEFAHFLHPDHSARFYELVEKLMPDWKNRKALLSDE